MNTRSLRARTVDQNDNAPRCEQAEATRELALEVRKLRYSVRAGIKQMQPTCDALTGAARRIKKWGPWLLASAPGVLVAIGALSPNAAAALKAFLAASGAS